MRTENMITMVCKIPNVCGDYRKFKNVIQTHKHYENSLLVT